MILLWIVNVYDLTRTALNDTYRLEFARILVVGELKLSLIKNLSDSSQVLLVYLLEGLGNVFVIN